MTKQMTAEASTLGFAPGRWPLVIEVEGTKFMFSRLEKNTEGETLAAFYVSGDESTTLTVFND